MTEKELKKFSRSELVELLLQAAAQNEELRAKVDELQAKLEDKTITVANAGSIAEAALSLSGIFEAAQRAADLFLTNVQQTDEICLRKQQETQAQTEAMVAEAEQKAAAIEMEAQQKAEAYWHGVSEKLQQFYDVHQGLQEMLAAEPTMKNE